MQYRITITKMVENPNYEAEKDGYEKAQRYGNRPFMMEDIPKRTVEVQALACDIEDEHFDAVRRALIEVL